MGERFVYFLQKLIGQKGIERHEYGFRLRFFVQGPELRKGKCLMRIYRRGEMMKKKIICIYYSGGNFLQYIGENNLFVLHTANSEICEHELSILDHFFFFYTESLHGNVFTGF